MLLPLLFLKKRIPHDRAKPLVRLARQGGGGQHLIPFYTLDAVQGSEISWGFWYLNLSPKRV